MKIIVKDTTELCNILYGDEQDYDYISVKDIISIIDDKIESLERIYDFLENSGFDYNDIYDLGDSINLVESFKQVIYLNEEEL